MADYRSLRTRFFFDSYVKTLTPLESYTYMVILQNHITNYCGLYEITFEDIAELTRIPLVDIKTIMAKLEKDDKIKYDHKTHELFIVNWIRHHKNESPKIMACAINDLAKVKSLALLKLWHEQAKAENYDIETPLDAAPDPNVKILVDHYNKAYKKIIGVAPPFSKADFGVTKLALREHKNNIDILKNIIEFGIEYIKSKKLTVTMKGCLGDWCCKSYHQAWSEHKWQYTGLNDPPCDKQWWRG